MAKKKTKKTAKRKTAKSTVRKAVKPRAAPARKRQFNAKPVAAILLIIIIVGGGVVFLQGSEENYYSFTACMSDSGLIEVGSDTCLHCENQKRVLGHDAFSVNFDGNGKYLRCNLDPLLCSNLGIRGTPTWYMPSETGTAIDVQGSRFQISGTFDEYLGEQSIEQLAEITGCPLPEGYDPSKAAQPSGGFTQTG